MNSMKKISGLELSQRKPTNQKNKSRQSKLVKRPLLRNTVGRESLKIFTRLLMKVSMFTSLLTRKDMNSLKANTAGITSMRKERSISSLSSQKDHGLEKEQESSSLNLTKEKLLFKKK